MPIVKKVTDIAELLENAAALREQAATLERVRGVITQRFHKHPNAFMLANVCHMRAQWYMAEFDRQIGNILNASSDLVEAEIENHNG